MAHPCVIHCRGTHSRLQQQEEQQKEVILLFRAVSSVCRDLQGRKQSLASKVLQPPPAE